MSAVGGIGARGRSLAPGSGPDVVLAGVAVLSILGAILAGMMAGQAPILAVAAASAFFLGTAIILRPDVATITTIAILYTNAAVIAVKFHNVPVFAAAVVPMLLAVPLARDLVVRRLPVVAPPMLGWMVALLFIHLVSALFAVDKTTAWDTVTVFIVEGFGIYFLLINVIRTPEMLRAVTWVLLASGALVSLLSVHQELTSNYGNDYFGFAQVSNAAFSTGVTTLTGDVTQPRLAGSIGETNRFAQVMLMLVPLGIFRFMSEPSRALRILAGVTTTVITLGVVLTFSRGAAVGLGMLLIALVALRMVQRQHIVAIGLALALVFVSFPQYWTRVSTLAAVGTLTEGGGTGAVDGSLLSRATETLSAALVMVDHPLIGVGPGLFGTYYEEYAQVVGIRIKNDAAREAHNLYLGLGAELGVTGLIVFLIVAILTVRMILLARRRSMGRRPDLERLTTPFALSIMTYHVTGMFLHLAFARFYWLMLAVAGAAALITLREMDATDAADASGDRSQGAYSQSV